MTLRIPRLALLGALLVAAGAVLEASGPPPVQGTMALAGTTKKVYTALNAILVETKDGMDHLIHYTKDLLVHGGPGTGVDALRGLIPGTTVVVHFTETGGTETAQEIDRIAGEGAGGLKVTEGTVTKVDHGRRQITIRYANGKSETLQLTERAAAEAGTGPASGTRVAVYYADESGRKVAHYFTPVP